MFFQIITETGTPPQQEPPLETSRGKKGVQFTVEEKTECDAELSEAGDTFNDTINMKSWRYTLNDLEFAFRRLDTIEKVPSAAHYRDPNITDHDGIVYRPTMQELVKGIPSFNEIAEYVVNKHETFCHVFSVKTSTLLKLTSKK